jgi:hypothetical protein
MAALLALTGNRGAPALPPSMSSQSMKNVKKKISKNTKIVTMQRSFHPIISLFPINSVTIQTKED